MPSLAVSGGTFQHTGTVWWIFLTWRHLCFFLAWEFVPVWPAASYDVSYSPLRNTCNVCAVAVLGGAGWCICPVLLFSVVLSSAHAVLPMDRCVMNVSCLRELHVICVHLRFLAGACRRTCALLRVLAALSGAYARFCGFWRRWAAHYSIIWLY
jgi:hypothetical protein